MDPIVASKMANFNREKTGELDYGYLEREEDLLHNGSHGNSGAGWVVSKRVELDIPEEFRDANTNFVRHENFMFLVTGISWRSVPPADRCSRSM